MNSSHSDKETNWIKLIGLWQSNLNYYVFAVLKIMGSLSYIEGAVKFFKI